MTSVVESVLMTRCSTVDTPLAHLAGEQQLGDDHRHRLARRGSWP
jgi:hypothetical protein